MLACQYGSLGSNLGMELKCPSIHIKMEIDFLEFSRIQKFSLHSRVQRFYPRSASHLYLLVLINVCLVVVHQQSLPSCSSLNPCSLPLDKFVSSINQDIFTILTQATLELDHFTLFLNLLGYLLSI